MSAGEIIVLAIVAVSVMVLLVMAATLKKFLKIESERRTAFESNMLEMLGKANVDSSSISEQLESISHGQVQLLQSKSTARSYPKIPVLDASQAPTGTQLEELKEVLASLDAVLAVLSTQLIEQNRHNHQETLKAIASVQNRLFEVLATDKFLSLLEDPQEQKRAILSAVRRLGDDDMVARLAIAYPSQGALSILQDIAVSGRGNELVGWALLGVADKHRASGKLELAETYYKQALLALEKSLGPVHEDVAEILESLSAIAISQGRAIEAEEFLARCAEVRSKLLGSDHSKVAESSIQLADLYVSQGRRQEAEPLYERALDITRKVLGPEHEQSMSLLRKLADIHETLESPGDAARIYEQIGELQSGQELQATLEHLIPFYQTTSNWPQLESVYRRLIDLCRSQSDATNQLRQAEYMRSLARVLRRQDKFEEATIALEGALAETERTLGLDHVDVITIVDELSDRLIESNKLKEAAPYVMRAFNNSLSNTESDRFRRILGKVKILAERLILEKEFDLAEDMYQQALTAMEKQKDPPRKAIVGLLRKIGALCAQIEDYEKSEAALRRAVRITELLFGDDHPETLTLLMQLGHLLQKGDKLQESESLYKRVLEMRYKILGDKHADLVESLVELAKLCKLQGNYTEAEIYQESAIEMAGAIYGKDSTQIEEIGQEIARVSPSVEPASV